MECPKCPKCDTGVLVPFSDNSKEGHNIHYKGWVCTNFYCGFKITSRGGEPHYGVISQIPIVESKR